MKAMGKVVFCFVVGVFIIGCSMSGQIQRSTDTQLSSYYQAMHDQVQRNNPEMDHVLTFCNEMIKIATQYEQSAITRQQFATKQSELRALLQQEDEYRRQSAWNQETSSKGPMEQYLQAANGKTEMPAEGIAATSSKTVSSENSRVK